MMKSKKGMIDGLVGLGYGLIVLAIMIGVGLVVLQNFGNAAGAGTANTTVTTLMGYLGTSTGGLVTWVPAIIALVIGLYFIGAFGGKGKRRV
jgi:uncharacterized membrane protein YfcA